MASLARMLIDGENVVVKGIELDDARQAVVIDTRHFKHQGFRCGRCGMKVPRYDDDQRAKLWTCCDLSGTKVYVRCGAFRVDCPEYDFIVRMVPWKTRGSWFTYAFEDTNC